MTILKLLFSFHGRINRARFWAVMLGFYGLLFTVIFLAEGFDNSAEMEDSSSYAPLELTDEDVEEWDYDPVTGAYVEPEPEIETSALIVGLAIAAFFLWIVLAVQVKRWHDRGKSGWMVLVYFIPLIGSFWVLIECGFLSGTAGPNQYGPDPLQ